MCWWVGSELGYDVYKKILLSFSEVPCDRGNDNVVTFSCLLLSVCSGSFRGSDKGLVWVGKGFKCSPDMLLFLLLPL